MKHYDAVALGECLVDFVCTSGENKLLLEGNAGGAPANVLAMMAKLGRRTALISKVGEDAFGTFLCEQIEKAKVDASFILRDSYCPTTLAIVQLDTEGNRSFNFYRDRTADVMLRDDELPRQLLSDTRLFHFGSLSLTAEPARTATFRAVCYAREAGALISFDPNLRIPLWTDLEVARAMMLEGLSRADFVKMSGEELTFLTGENDIRIGAVRLCREYPIMLLAITLGAGGCVYCVNGRLYESSAFAVQSVDTTGAGDASWGAALSLLMETGREPQSLTDAELYRLMDFANAAGSLTTTRYGAIPALPDRNAIEACIRDIPRLAIGV